MNRIVLGRHHWDNIDEIVAWCNANVGKGSRRYRVNTWMGTDDWFCHEDIPPVDEDNEEDEDIALDTEPDNDFIFVFRREEDSTMFAIKWA